MCNFPDWFDESGLSDGPSPKKNEKDLGYGVAGRVPHAHAKTDCFLFVEKYKQEDAMEEAVEEGWLVLPVTSFDNLVRRPARQAYIEQHAAEALFMPRSFMKDISIVFN